MYIATAHEHAPGVDARGGDLLPPFAAHHRVHAHDAAPEHEGRRREEDVASIPSARHGVVEEHELLGREPRVETVKLVGQRVNKFFSQ